MPPLRPSSRHRLSFGAALVLLALVSTACGSAVPHDDVVQAARGVGVGQVVDGAGGTGDGADPLAAGGTPDSAAGAAADPGAPAGAGEGAEAGAPAAGGTTTTGGGGAKPGAGTGAAPGAGTGAAPGAGGAAAPAGGDTSPVVIGTVGNFSGAPGVTLKPSSVGVKVWADAVNAKGGLAGHKVQVVVVDDQSDPARYRQIVQDLVENKKVVAFVGNAAATSNQSGKAYLDKAKVPVVGSGDGSPIWTSSPMHFSVVSSGAALVYGNFSIAKSMGKKKVGVLSCVEASSCSEWKASAKKYAPKVGIPLGYTADISITQADFTAECLNARNADVDVLAVIGDQNTLYRVARNCASQGYRPTFISPSPSDADAAKPDLPGLIGASHEFPFDGVKGNPASDEYTAALARYAPEEAKSQYLAAGWLSGKTFEKAFLAGVAGKKPTSAGVLAGLATFMKGERVGGLAAALDFRPGQANGQAFCYFTNVVKGGRWTAPNGMTPTCAAP